MTRRTYQPTRHGTGRYRLARVHQRQGWTILRDGRPLTEVHPTTGQRIPIICRRATAALLLAEELARRD